jgi:hypothetical protein
LLKARLSTPVYHSSCSGLPIRAGEDLKIYKLLYLDIGLLVSAQGLDFPSLTNLSDRNLLNEGPLAEQFIGQHLLSQKSERELSYWLREGKLGNAEVDFVISKGLSIIPIEVKGGKSGTLKSLHQFVYQKQAKVALRFDVNLHSRQAIQYSISSPDSKNLSVNYELYSLPLYLVSKIDQVLEEAL